VKVSGVVKAPCSITTGTVQIVADPDAMLTPTIAGPALEVKGTANIEIHDLQISNTIGTDAPGVTLSGSASLALIHVTVNNNSGHGIDASGGTIIVTRSTISNNINSGIRVTGTVNFHVVGNVIFGNGTPGKAGTSGLFIGVDAQPLGVSSNEIAFNSISHNVGGSSDTGSGSGTQCTAVTPLVASSNVIWNNGPFSLSPQVSGAGCSYIFSDIGPVGVGTTDSNNNSDPMFADEAAGNLHLLPTSVVIQKADPTATLDGLAAKDIDGDLRVKAGAEMAADMGADQVRVQFHAGEALGRATKP
jgi:hypothetical protein